MEAHRVVRLLYNRLTDGGELVSLTQEDSWYSFLLEAESTPGLGKLKNPVTSSGIEPATFRLAA
jgi:hypothetical protein